MRSDFIIGDKMGQLILILLDHCYLLSKSLPSYIKLLQVVCNNYELKPQFISMLPKFIRSDYENASLFISKFQKVCAMIKLQYLSEYAIQFCFIPFALKIMPISGYSMPTNLVITWDKFMTVFL